MSVIVKGMQMPEKCGSCDLFHAESPMHCTVVKGHKTVGAPYGMPRPEWCPLFEIPEKHGRLIDADELRRKMYHDAFETDTDFQMWNSGCWIRYKMFENNIDAQPTVIEAEDGTCTM